MTVYELKRNYYKNNPDGHFFDRDTLRFFGERMSDMRVLKNTVIIKDYRGNDHECYCLSSYQRKHPCGPTRAYHYFDVKDFDNIVI